MAPTTSLVPTVLIISLLDKIELIVFFIDQLIYWIKPFTICRGGKVIKLSISPVNEMVML